MKKSFRINKDVFAAKENNQWVTYSNADYIRLSNFTSIGLLLSGLKKGDKVATISNNIPEWNFMEIGMMQIGVIHVTVYPTISTQECEHILTHSDARILVVSDI